MSSIIKLKRSLTPGAVPGSLQAGELAINLPDKKLYSSNGTSVFNVSGDQYNLTSSAVDSGAAVTLTVDNDALSNDAIQFLGGTGITVTRNANSSVTITATGTANAGDNTVSTASIQDGAVTSAKIAAGGITANAIGNDSVALGTKTTGNYVAGVTGGTDITVTGSGSEGATPTVTLNDAIAANTSGTAATATALATARNIGGVSFDGTANIDLPGVNTTGNQNTTGSAATLTTARAIAVSGSVTGTANFDGSAGITISTTLADSIAANTSGTAATATALATARDIAIAGDVTGTASFDGTSNITITVAQANDSVDLGTHTTGNYAAAVTGTANEIEVTGSAGEGTTFQIGLPNDVTIGNDLTVTNDLGVSGNLTVDGNLEVNGTLTYIDSTTVTIGDNMLKLANNNVADTADMGFYSKFDDGSVKYTGLVRDATNGEYTLFTDLATEPDQQINFGNATTATLNAVIDGGTF